MSLNIGMIGTDSSHTIAFAEIINDAGYPFHVAGGKITKIVRYSSSDFPLSYSREEQFSSQLMNEYQIPFCQISDFDENCDAFMIAASDGRMHLELFKQLMVWKKPIFIDKPLAIGYEAAQEIIRLAEEHNVPIMSCSGLRYSSALQHQLRNMDTSQIKKVTVNCPLYIEPTQSRYYWYAIHGVEILYAILGRGCKNIEVSTTEHSDIITGKWDNGIVGEVVCVQDTSQPFEVILHTETEDVSISLSAAAHQIPFYSSLIEKVMLFFNERQSPIFYDEMLEVIWFIDQAEQNFQKIKSI